MSDHDEIIAGYRCRKCGAKKGDPCLYMTPRDYRPQRGSVSGALILERAGKPMKGTHIERRQRFWDDYHKRKNAELLAVAKASQPAWLYAIKEFDARENEAMKQWLRANAVRLFRLRKVEP